MCECDILLRGCWCLIPHPPCLEHHADSPVWLVAANSLSEKPLEQSGAQSKAEAEISKLTQVIEERGMCGILEVWTVVRHDCRMLLFLSWSQSGLV